MKSLSLFYPVKPIQLNQGWGVNGAYYQANGINIIGHNGLDYAATHGQPVRAAHDGYAYFEIDDKGGHGVIIRTKEPFDYSGDPRYSQVYFKTIYWHLCDASKEPQFASPIKATDITGLGQEVFAGDIIGYADATGLATGDHLHFGLKPIMDGEPLGTWYNLQPNNGFLGCIDPTPYMNGYYAEDSKQVMVNLTTQVSLYEKLLALLKNFLGL